MTARELFREIRNLDIQIDNKMARLGELRLGASGIGGCDYSLERVQTSSSGEPPYVRQVGRIFALDAEIDTDIDRLADFKIEAWRRMRCLPARDREILELRYFEHRTWPEIAERAGLSERHIRRLHVMALDRMDAQDVVVDKNEKHKI